MNIGYIERFLNRRVAQLFYELRWLYIVCARTITVRVKARVIRMGRKGTDPVPDSPKATDEAFLPKTQEQFWLTPV